MMFFRGTGGLGRCFEGGSGFAGGYMHGGLGPMMMIGALLVVVLVVVAIVVIVKNWRRVHELEQGNESLAILNERFVKGELTEEEYTRMKRALRTK